MSLLGRLFGGKPWPVKANVMPPDGSIERTSVFNLGAAVKTYRIRSEGTTDAVQRPWHVGWRKDYAL